MRALARDLEVSQSLLSLILSGRRRLSPRVLERTLRFLALPAAEKKEWENRLRLKGDRGKRAHVTESNRLIDETPIHHWYMLALLDLATLPDGCRADPDWIARRLGITRVEAEFAATELEAAGMLIREKEILRKKEQHLYFPSKTSLPLLRELHRQLIQKALDQLERIDPASFKKRKIVGTTFAIRSAHLGKANTLIQKFQKDMAALLTEGDCDEVYQLNIQLFPLSQPARTRRPS